MLKSSDDLPTGFQFPEIMYQNLLTSFDAGVQQRGQLNADERERILSGYYELAKEYAHRSLTYGSDKLPALSGLCERVHDLVGGDFLAGFWSCDIQRGLLWYKEMISCKHVPPYRAPSWSWAVTDDRVICDEGTIMACASDLRLVSHDVKVQDQSNPYGEIVSGKIVVEGLIMPLARSTQAVRLVDDAGKIGGAHFDEPEIDGDETSIDNLFRVDTDAGKHLMSLWSTNVGDQSPDWEIDTNLWSSQEYLALLVHVNAQDESVKPPAVGLVLRRIGDVPGREYERVGYFKIHAEILLSWYENWSRETLTLV